VLATIWFPVLWKYRVWGGDVDPVTVERLRSVPSTDRLRELVAIDLGDLPWAKLAPVADSLLAGEPVQSGHRTYRLSARFSAQDVVDGPPELELAMASWLIPSIMLRAYEETRNPRYLDVAVDYVRGWAEFERAMLVPRALVWNDHAIAARVFVLTRLWMHYRQRGDGTYDPEFAGRLHSLADSYGQLLSRRVLYTFRTNHGTMQNLTLLVMSLAFPELKRAPEWAETGYRRFLEQAEYYIGPDGVINEHSPGYQAFGIELLGATLRCLTLLGKPIPVAIADRYDRAKDFYTQLWRPDGTLPTIGDTEFGPRYPLVSSRETGGGFGSIAPVKSEKPASSTLHPDGAMLVWWNGLDQWPKPRALSQLVVTWANFPSQVHKHADEGSLALWSGGAQWLGNVGYWPYHDSSRGAAEGWSGGNALHLVGETLLDARETQPLLNGVSAQLSFFEIERKRPDGFATRRQIVRHASGLWLILDTSTDTRSREVNTVWSTSPHLTATRLGADNAFRLNSPDHGTSVVLHFIGSSGHDVFMYRGSRQPFAGWAALTSHTVSEATAFLVRNRSDGAWSAIAVVPDNDGQPRLLKAPQMASWTGPERWTLRFETDDGPVTLSRDGARVDAIGPAGASTVIGQPVPMPQQRASMEAAYRRVVEETAPPRWYGDFVPYRFRASYLVLGLVFGQLVVFAAVSRLTPRFSVLLAGLAAVCWIAAGLWLNFVYFA